MSVPFTDPTVEDFEIFKTSNVNQLLNAYNERREVLGQSAVGTIGDYTTEASKTSLWSGMQEWIESNCVNFVDHTQDPFTGLATFPKFTLSSFRAAAGLHADGFRRVPSGIWDGTGVAPYQYGIQQHYDLIWWWTYQDLQDAFSTLRWTEETSGFTQAINENLFGQGPYPSNLVCPTGFAIANAIYAASSWIPWASNDVYRVHAPLYQSPPGTYNYVPSRQRGAAQVVGLDTVRASKLRVYFLPRVSIYAPPPTFYDIDNLGMQDGKLYYFEEMPLSSAASRTSSLFDPTANNPYLNAGVNCSNQQVYTIHVDRFDVKYTYNWEFTNEN